MPLRLPSPRGPLSETLCERLQGRPGRIVGLPVDEDEPLSGDDLQLSLHLCYGLHYEGFLGVDDRWEWEPSVADVRSSLERRFLDDLMAAVPDVGRPGVSGRSSLERIARLLEPGGTEPSLSQFVLEQGTLDQVRELVIHRSIYQRKEADPHTWAIPRLRGRAKSAIVTLQADEYGNGVVGRSHAELFAATMLALDLDPTPGIYIDRVPGVTLATDNLITMFGRSRRWRGALVGHLAVFEMTSVGPMSRYAAALRRMHVAEEGVEFYDVHVEADVLHARIAADDLVGGMVDDDPDAAADIAFGAAALLEVESRFSRHLLASWVVGRSSLRSARLQTPCQATGTGPTARGPDLATVGTDPASADGRLMPADAG